MGRRKNSRYHRCAAPLHAILMAILSVRIPAFMLHRRGARGKRLRANGAGDGGRALLVAPFSRHSPAQPCRPDGGRSSFAAGKRPLNTAWSRIKGKRS